MCCNAVQQELYKPIEPAKSLRPMVTKSAKNGGGCGSQTPRALYKPSRLPKSRRRHRTEIRRGQHGAESGQQLGFNDRRQPRHILLQIVEDITEECGESGNTLCTVEGAAGTCCSAEASDESEGTSANRSPGLLARTRQDVSELCTLALLWHTLRTDALHGCGHAAPLGELPHRCSQHLPERLGVETASSRAVGCLGSWQRLGRRSLCRQQGLCGDWRCWLRRHISRRPLLRTLGCAGHCRCQPGCRLRACVPGSTRHAIGLRSLARSH
mmetsp:Transcript_35123/g.113716  ORF Transcript_35123/g.113716 Transcript_35123/m.113716 type:complete len:269 (+) Transcript_35123:114-920(+)